MTTHNPSDGILVTRSRHGYTIALSEEHLARLQQGEQRTGRSTLDKVTRAVCLLLDEDEGGPMSTPEPGRNAPQHAVRMDPTDDELDDLLNVLLDE